MLKAYADPEVRRKLHDEAVEFKSGPAIGICSTWWDYMVLQVAMLPKNKEYEGKTVGQIAKSQGKGIIDCFLDLAIEENLDTEWLHGENNVDDAAVAQILNYPNAIIGLSDGGAHVQFQSGFGFSTRLLSEWVRDKAIMSLETAVRRLTFESASTFGLYDRGLLRPGMVADIVIFDPDTVKPLAARGRPRFPDRRQAHQGAGPGHPHDDRQRPSAARRGQTHRRPTRPGLAQHLLQGQPRLAAAPRPALSLHSGERESGARRREGPFNLNRPGPRSAAEREKPQPAAGPPIIPFAASGANQRQTSPASPGALSLQGDPSFPRMSGRGRG